MIQSFISTYCFDIILALILVIAIALLLKTEHKKLAYRIIHQIISKADEHLDSMEGQKAYNYIYGRLPISIRLLLSKKELLDIINKIMDNLKENTEQEE